MKLKLIATALVAALSSSAAVAQEAAESPWMMIVRAAHLSPADKTDTLNLEVESKMIPDISFRYSFTRNIAAELLLTVPQKHEVKLNGTNIGSFKHLPPTLFAQYHFTPDSNFRPYIGAGINYTRISNVNLLNGAADLEKNSWGPAAQIGFDYKVANNGYISVDLKKIYIQSDVFVGGVKVDKVKVDPTLFAIGYGFRF
jgi:outer membrane protein